MPIYEYRCRSCGRAFEELVLGGATPRCPECEGDDLERMMSVTAPGRVSNGAPALPAACGGCPQAGNGTCGVG